MMAITPEDWGRVFDLQTPVLEIVARGTATYLALFVLLRVLLKRESAAVGMTDLLVVVLIADAAQNAMAANYTTVSDGLVLVATILVWAYALDWLAFHASWFAPFVRPPSLPLVEDGRMLRRNMRKELITYEELMSQLRQAGVEELGQVKRAYMESDGGISVLRHDGEDSQRRSRRAPA